MDSLYVGIDVAKASFVAAAHGPAGESLWGEFANTPAGFEQWRARVCAAVDEQLTPGVVVVLEPTGGSVNLGAGTPDIMQVRREDRIPPEPELP